MTRAPALSPTILLGAGDGTFGCEQNFTAISGHPTFADLNGDERVDIVTTSNREFVTVFFQPTR